MITEQFIAFCIAFLALISAIGLVFVKIDKNELKNKTHSFPQMALFRFPAFRWGMIVVCLLFFLVSLFVGFGWLS
jgi:hypothetical protein